MARSVMGRPTLLARHAVHRALPPPRVAGAEGGHGLVAAPRRTAWWRGGYLILRRQGQEFPVSLGENHAPGEVVRPSGVNSPAWTPSVRAVVQPGAGGRAMSGSQRGNHLGPFKLEQRHRHTEHLGRVYPPRSTERGAPALVLRPTGRDPESPPLADWRLRLFSSVPPAYLALEVEAAPEAANAPDAGEELEAMLEDLLEAVMHTNARPETLGHLRSPRRLPPPRALPKPARRWLQPVLGAALAASFAAALLFAGNSERTPVDDWTSRPELAQARNDGGWGGAGDLTG